ncbi:hypothetical protein CYMTET_12395 [Cymbomonas tetramitiformis]|uniref:Uncharacterized protein n=1 Tax=Cymbomonas tetramitiformis TaxID=36881 RepID=A0AAE0LCH6_9CHLO|nr:hypothetical protein CYMTET_12395 [Cymbomonas tetramitiformis]
MLRSLREIKKLVAAKTLIGNWSITSTTVHDGANFNYVMKADTRIDGPWSDKDFVEPPALTRQLQNLMGKDFYPWQNQLLEMVDSYDERTIKLVYDVHGNAGKSIFCDYLEYNQKAFEIPPLRSLQGIMGVCMSVPKSKCYICDMPKAMKKDKLAELYSGLECLKNGKMYDIRYSYKCRRIDRPQIIVFTNMLPNWDLMVRDRWEVWEMQPDKSLTKYKTPHNSGDQADLHVGEASGSAE